MNIDFVKQYIHSNEIYMALCCLDICIYSTCQSDGGWGVGVEVVEVVEVGESWWRLEPIIHSIYTGSNCSLVLPLRHSPLSTSSLV